MRLLLLMVLLSASTALAQRGVPQNGFPSWSERTVQMLVNRSRAEPTADPKACSATTVRPPLVWSYNLNRSARFHSTHMQKSGQFMHPSPCVLASDIATTFAPGTGCDGAVACACSTGAVTCTSAQNTAGSCSSSTSTSWSGRISMLGTSPSAENIAYGYGSPRNVHSGWMNSSGHCTNILGGAGQLGVGHFASGSYWTENFAGGGSLAGSLISGSHEPQNSGAAIEFRVNYYNTAGGPQRSQLNVDGACSPMTLERGTESNGTWLATQTLSGTACRRYVFTFTDPSGAVVSLPETGSYGVGGSPTSCPDWSATAPASCPGSGNQSPTIATAASAAPNPVTAATTQLATLGADDDGEAALTYTWSATGPATVTFSDNGTNAAKAVTATFTRAGTYLITVTVRDAFGATNSSQVTVTVQPVLERLTVAPAMASVEVGQTVTFTASGRDQFGDAMTAAAQWTVGGGGTIDARGVFTASATAGGPHTVTATAGGFTATAHVTVTPGPPPPLTVQLTQPAAGATVSGVVTLAATASDDARVAEMTFLVDGALVGTDTTAPFATLWNTTSATEGPHRLSARATDGAGVSVTSTEVSVTVTRATTVDTTPPVVTLDSPSGTVTGPALLRATATDDVGVVEVVFELDGTEVARLAQAPWAHDVPADQLLSGGHQVRVTARDGAGNTANASGSFTVPGSGVPGEPTEPVVGGCGCGSPGAAALGDLGLLALALRRRRRSRAAASR